MHCLALYLLLWNLKCATAPPVKPGSRPDSPPAITAIGFKCWAAILAIAALLVVVHLMMKNGGTARSRNERAVSRETLNSEIQQAWSEFDPDTAPAISLRPYEKAFAEIERRGISTFTVVAEVESEFKLKKHTLTKFLEWKKKSLVAMPPETTAAERQAAKRSRDAFRNCHLTRKPRP
jgi:hypothetical protein